MTFWKRFLSKNSASSNASTSPSTSLSDATSNDLLKEINTAIEQARSAIELARTLPIESLLLVVLLLYLERQRYRFDGFKFRGSGSSDQLMELLAQQFVKYPIEIQLHRESHKNPDGYISDLTNGKGISELQVTFNAALMRRPLTYFNIVAHNSTSKIEYFWLRVYRTADDSFEWDGKYMFHDS